MKTLRQIFEELDTEQMDIVKKIQEVSLNSDALKRQIVELNNMWKKKAIDDAEYKKRMDDLNKQLTAQKQQAERNRLAQTATNQGINQPQKPII